MRKKPLRILTYTMLLLGAALFAAPMAWMVATSLKPEEQNAQSRPTWLAYQWHATIDGQQLTVGVDVDGANEQSQPVESDTSPEGQAAQAEDDVPAQMMLPVTAAYQWRMTYKDEGEDHDLPARLIPDQDPQADPIEVEISLHYRVTLDEQTLASMEIPDNKRKMALGWVVGHDLPVRIVERDDQTGIATAGFFNADGDYLMQLPVPINRLQKIYNTELGQQSASYSEKQTLTVARSDLQKVYLAWDDREFTPYVEKDTMVLARQDLKRTLDPRWENYPRAIERMGMFWRYLFNTLTLCFLTVLGTVFSSAMVAYGFSRIDWPGRNKMFAVVLATMMVPFPVLMVPMYALFRELGWIGTLKPLWVPFFFASAFNVFLLRQFFMTIPRDITEAARIDGCSELRIFLQIILPLAKPALMVVALFQFMATWNDFLGPVIYLTDQADYTLALGLQQFQSQQNGVPWNLLMAASSLIVLPVVLLFFITQRTFIEGISMTGLKG